MTFLMRMQYDWNSLLYAIDDTKSITAHLCPHKSAMGKPSAQILLGVFQELNFYRYRHFDVTRFSAAAMMANNTAYTKCVRAFSSKIILFYYFFGRGGGEPIMCALTECTMSVY
jgi:hypothetical protein